MIYLILRCGEKYNSDNSFANDCLSCNLKVKNYVAKSYTSWLKSYKLHQYEHDCVVVCYEKSEVLLFKEFFETYTIVVYYGRRGLFSDTESLKNISDISFDISSFEFFCNHELQEIIL